ISILGGDILLKMTNDLDLLRQFARENSQDAFTEIVRRHVNLVYSAALRQVRSPQLAEEIAQSVFADLARNASKLKPDTILTAWLYSVTRWTAIDVIRKESRRQLREQIAVEMSDMNATTNDWTQIEPLLDDAMAALDETDRAAILLRYFENKNLREVGEQLKISDDTAQKRVSRAVEKLREFFSKQKISIGASGLAVLISANAVQAAPIGLASTISAAAILAGTAISTSTVITATKTIAMTTFQKTFAAAALTAAIGTGIFEAHQNSQLREQVQNLQQTQNEQLAKLQRERDDATNQLVSLFAENAQLKSNSNENELLKLRGEIGLLKQSVNHYSNQVDQLSRPYGLLPEEIPPVYGGSVPDTGHAYAKLVEKLAAGQLTPAEEFNLLKAWPYLKKRFDTGDQFAFFQSEYLAEILDLKDDSIKSQLRQILEKAEDNSYAHGLRWATMPDEELQHYPTVITDIDKIRQQWNELNQKTVETISGLLTDEQRQIFLSGFNDVLDFDPRLKSSPGAVTNNPKFQNLTVQEIVAAYEALLPKYTQGTPLEYKP
ncbi:MAG TPA: sigma-70 family RNA polymerase sigma factor, partial [Verrucomicrobiae bacterium]